MTTRPFRPRRWKKLAVTGALTCASLYALACGALYFLQDSFIPIKLARQLADGFTGPKKTWIDSERDHDASAILYDRWAELWQWIGKGN